MAYKKSLQQGLVSIESAVGSLKQVFNQQNEMLDDFVTDSVSLNTDLMEFVKKRSELQMEYGRSLQTLCDRQLKKYHSLFEKQRRSNKCNSSMFGCFYQLLISSRYEATDFIGVSQMTSDVNLPLIDHALSDLKVNQWSFKKVLNDTQNELTGQSTDLVLNIKEYNHQFATFKENQSKLDSVTSDLAKLHRSLDNKGKEPSASSKYKSLTKAEVKRRENFVQSRQKLNKARNDYLLSLQALTHFRYKLFNDDIPALFENLTSEFYVVMKLALRNLCQAQVKRISNAEICNEKLEEKVVEVDFSKEWASIYDSYSECLEIPDSKLEFLPAYTKECLDSINSLQLDSDVKERYPIIIQNFEANLLKSREISEQIDAAKRSINNIAANVHLDVSEYLNDLQNVHGSTGTLQNTNCEDSPNSEHSNGTPQNGQLASSTESELSTEVSLKQSLVKLKSQYSCVTTKFRELFSVSNKAARLKARKDLIESTFGGALETAPNTYKQVSVKRQESVRITKYVPRPVAAVNVKLFGGDIEQYCKAIQKDIPPVVLSCIEFIRENGMFNQGIFRVSGAKSAVRYLKDYFESGDDPLLSPSADSTSEQYEVGAVAELLKLYFRQLQEPSLPNDILTAFLDAHKALEANANAASELEASTGSDHSEGGSELSSDSVVETLKNVLSNLPYSTMVTLRYLFAFLHSLTRFSDENMMDSYNLAIVWGPTLVRPEEEDLVAFQTPITLLVQFLIVNHFRVFPQDSGSLFSDTVSHRDRPRTLSISNDMGSTSSLVDSITDETASPYSQNNNSIFDNGISPNVEVNSHSSSFNNNSQITKLPPNTQFMRVPRTHMSPSSSDSGESHASGSQSPLCSPKHARQKSTGSVIVSSALVALPGDVVKEAAVFVNKQ